MKFRMLSKSEYTELDVDEVLRMIRERSADLLVAKFGAKGAEKVLRGDDS